jgi:flagellar hook-basal body complex protein FliE
MPSPITPITPAGIQPVRLPEISTASTGGNSGASFQNVLNDAIQRVESYRQTADTAVQRFLTGEDQELHKVAIATQQAELSFELFLQVKNKVVQAYQEIMRMQV